jgi:hypothetical protein
VWRLFHFTLRRYIRVSCTPSAVELHHVLSLIIMTISWFNGQGSCSSHTVATVPHNTFQRLIAIRFSFGCLTTSKWSLRKIQLRELLIISVPWKLFSAGLRIQLFHNEKVGSSSNASCFYLEFGGWGAPTPLCEVFSWVGIADGATNIRTPHLQLATSTQTACVWNN